MKECEDKNSVHYFMRHMTQEEWEKRLGDFPLVKNLKFNLIQPERSKREDKVEESGKSEFVGEIRRMTRGQL